MGEYKPSYKLSKGYRPRWSKDEVLAFFYSNLSSQTAKPVGEALGYEYLGQEEGSNTFRFRTPEGKVKEACSRFESFDELVEWAEPVDLKMESRCGNLEETVKMIGNIDYLTSNKDYGKQKDEVIRKLRKVK